MRNIKPLKDIDLDLNILDNNKLDKKIMFMIHLKE